MAMEPGGERTVPLASHQGAGQSGPVLGADNEEFHMHSFPSLKSVVVGDRELRRFIERLDRFPTPTRELALPIGPVPARQVER